MKKISFYIISAVMILGLSEIAAKLFLYLVLNVASPDYLSYYINDKNLTLVAWGSGNLAHPYFGYETDRIREFERIKGKFTADDFVIGILGGSVAEQVGSYLTMYSARLNRLRAVLPSFSAKNLHVVNLAMGGGKQPQQFFISAYFSNDLDMVINIDGFNETGSEHFLPIYPLDFPILSLRFYKRTTEGRAYAALGRLMTSAYKSINEFPLRFSWASKSSLYFATWYTVHNILYSRIVWLNAKYYDAAISEYQSSDIRSVSPNTIMKEKVNIWKRYTTLQYELLTRHDEKPTFFFVQPNQYLKGSKILSEEELRIAIDSRVEDIRHEQMTLLRTGFTDLRKSGIPIFDMTKVFLGHTNSVYRDNCCHLNALGVNLLTEAIISSIENYQSAFSIGACDDLPDSERCLN